MPGCTTALRSDAEASPDPCRRRRHVLGRYAFARFEVLFPVQQFVECHCARRNSVQFATDFRGNNIQVAVALSGHHARNIVRSRLSGSSHVENRRRAEAAHPRSGRRDRAPSSAKKNRSDTERCRRPPHNDRLFSVQTAKAARPSRNAYFKLCRAIATRPNWAELPRAFAGSRPPAATRAADALSRTPSTSTAPWAAAILPAARTQGLAAPGTHPHSCDYERELFPHAPGMSACRRARSFDTYNMHSCSGMQASEELSIAAPIGILLLSNTVICA